MSCSLFDHFPGALPGRRPLRPGATEETYTRDLQLRRPDTKYENPTTPLPRSLTHTPESSGSEAVGERRTSVTVPKTPSLEERREGLRQWVGGLTLGLWGPRDDKRSPPDPGRDTGPPDVLHSGTGTVGTGRRTPPSPWTGMGCDVP